MKKKTKFNPALLVMVFGLTFIVLITLAMLACDVYMSTNDPIWKDVSNILSTMSFISLGLVGVTMAVSLNKGL